MLNLKHIPNILVIGDLIIDCYIWGIVERISPEAPVQILKINDENNRLGGACNVAKNLTSLGANVSLCGIIGDDFDGRQLLDMLKESNINSELIILSKNFNTIKKTRFIASNQQVLRVDREYNKISLDSKELDFINCLEVIQNKIVNFDCIILSDYAKGALSDNFTKEIISLANKHNKLILCDPKGNDYSKYSNSTLLTPNKKEAQIATNIEINSQDSLLESLVKLKNDYNLKYSLITLSEDGMAIYDNKMTRIPTLAKEIYDVTGAGDTVIAALAFGLCNGMDIYESARFASIAAAVVVGKIGSAQAMLSEILSFMKANVDDISLISSYKKDGKKIVFTNGCFDILHYGHLSYLKKAKSFGDILVVGLNSDSSVKKLKGNTRPINSQDDRANVLRELECVDFVIIFDEETPLNLIKQIMPDILVKGGDYKDKEVVGSNIINDVRLVDYIPNKSTTNIINKIKGL
ncbi:D-glycero-beta-D-manno-heptose-7-phosphate kinase [Helicobacter sp. MIT 14-3879]|uniref:D-glycero-beta-D-manno-heptose-7-phosphate kinase n=1 Tax=Helicobacter sp. MIT 14-3879 TaxID=2040649 RepID=UPI000E1E3E41|nr:D-glycero-beta-D-manno-heptose-7-phosphate kinase [Helicobacter sp. MIT 14-3879]RDU63957.1 bifunctional heptose 7-phosphate kinase/heptose 1-phosphate adenyltransferase [Helicobacter sp. MIT 14-3879]